MKTFHIFRQPYRVIDSNTKEVIDSHPATCVARVMAESFMDACKIMMSKPFALLNMECPEPMNFIQEGKGVKCGNAGCELCFFDNLEDAQKQAPKDYEN